MKKGGHQVFFYKWSYRTYFTVWSCLYSQQNLFDPILMKLPHLLYDPHKATAPTVWSSWSYRTYCMILMKLLHLLYDPVYIRNKNLFDPILMKLSHLLYDPHAPATAPTLWSSCSYCTYCMILFIFATKPLWSHPHESTEPTVLLGALFTDS